MLRQKLLCNVSIGALYVCAVGLAKYWTLLSEVKVLAVEKLCPAQRRYFADDADADWKAGHDSNGWKAKPLAHRRRAS